MQYYNSNFINEKVRNSQTIRSRSFTQRCLQLVHGIQKLLEVYKPYNWPTLHDLSILNYLREITHNTIMEQQSVTFNQDHNEY